MTKVKFPSIKDVANELRHGNQHVETSGHEDDDSAWCDVRLQVYPSSQWSIHYGSPDYDQNHNGYWGCDSIPGVRDGVVKRFNSRELAKDLIDQCKDAYEEAKYDENTVQAIADKHGGLL